jgi:hypothetical protein
MPLATPQELTIPLVYGMSEYGHGYAIFVAGILAAI